MNDEAVYRTAPATPGLLKRRMFVGLLLLMLCNAYATPETMLGKEKEYIKIVKVSY